MERRMALASAVAAAVTFGIGTVCFASLGGTDILGLSNDGAMSMVPASTPQTITRVVVVVGPDGSVTGTSLVTETVAPADPTQVAETVLPTDAPQTPQTPQAAPSWVSPAGGTAAPTMTSAWVQPTPAETEAPYVTQAPVTTGTRAPVTTSRPAPSVTTTTRPAQVVTTTTVHVTTTSPATNPPTTAAPVTTTTAAPAPTSTLPKGVPADWPVGKPIPPKPPNCVNGILEDNGVWNCEH